MRHMHRTIIFNLVMSVVISPKSQVFDARGFNETREEFSGFDFNFDSSRHKQRRERAAIASYKPTNAGIGEPCIAEA